MQIATFESLVNSKGSQTLTRQCIQNLEFESLVNSKGSQTDVVLQGRAD